MVKLRVRELAQEKVYHLLSLTSGVPEEAIRTYATQTTDDFKKIAIALNWPVTESGVAQVFQMLDPVKANEMAIDLLSKASGISPDNIQKYANENEDFNITEKIEDLRKIAKALDVEMLELVKLKETREAVKLKIAKLAQNKNLSLKELANQSKVDFPILWFYSSQPIEKKKLTQEPFQTNLNKISRVLNSSFEDLQGIEQAELPQTTLQVKEFLDAADLSINDLSLLTGVNREFIDLVATNPMDLRNIQILREDKVICKLICTILGCNCD
ncbi:hypothetical protein NIES4072_42140 [Nostoc commune NIES-4072]|uniref:HTH cro/C1-type domain-containing protein n=1 Tax=Nostoc commune NIES-4072 TaxID=2005467 RepID=A0A2R5FXZ2_NOSCO|nr:helix-turn-helix transcriptional regulator [Nostoc commune]BBD68474.1 hypothetical protein NIES4070_48710 [Nostoc commune HK-02]GBG20534.1 hypothetical protein NIES4072_42140 [Nostoc commune NIES-4072]